MKSGSKIGDQLVSKVGGEEGVWRMIEVVLEAVEGRDRELKLANERIGVLTRRIEELEQGAEKTRDKRDESSKQVKGRDRREGDGGNRRRASVAITKPGPGDAKRLNRK